MTAIGLLVGCGDRGGPAPAATGSAAPADKPLAKLVIALKPDKDPDKMLEERKTLGSTLAKVVGRPVDVIVPLSASVIQEGLAGGTLDAAYVSSTDFSQARKVKSAELLLANEIDGKTTYQSYWLALADAPYSSVEELRGKRVAFASKTSTSGYIVPLWDLRKRGLIEKEGRAEDFFGAGNVSFGTGYVSAVERVLSKDAEAAAVSDYVFDGERHLSKEQRAKLKVVAAQGPVPTHVIAVRASLGKADRDALEKALLSLNEPEGSALRDRIFTAKLVRVEADAHLGELEAAVEFASRP